MKAVQDDKPGLHNQSIAESQSCPVCTLQPVCVPWELEPEDLQSLEGIVEHPERFAADSHLFRFGDSLRAIYVVRSGAFKVYRSDTWGRERVLGFSLAGELVGIDGIYPQRHVSHAIALEDSDVCAFPYTELASRMERSEGLRRQIFRLVSRDTGHNLALTRDSNADERVARFLLDLSRRHERQGRPSDEFPLPLSRPDMGNYLRISVDMIRKVFDRFTARELISVEGQRIRLLDMGKLIQAAGK
ncbi:MAG TPA: cyclic nucleotide-binding domain-containing protein [Gammaproteobacteria bacterium]|jgi:CRP/FNR family transcriptional regulator